MVDDNGLAKGTRSTYNTGVKRLAKYIRSWAKHGVYVRFRNPSGATLCFFILFLSTTLSPGTIKNYLFGIRHYNVSRGYPDPLSPGVALWGMMNALDASYAGNARKRRPLTLLVLSLLYKFVDFDVHNERCVWAAVTVGVYLLLRVGEIAPKSGRRPRHTDWRVDGGVAVFHLPKSKSDRAGRGVKLIAHSVDNPSCPVTAMHEYISLSPFTPANPLYYGEQVMENHWIEVFLCAWFEVGVSEQALTHLVTMALVCGKVVPCR